MKLALWSAAENSFSPWERQNGVRLGTSMRLLQVSIEPRERALESVDAMPRLAQPVPFTRIAHQDCIHTAPSDCHVHLFCLSNVHIVVLLSMNEHRRCLCLSGVTQRRPLPWQIVIVPLKSAKLCMKQILIKRSRVEPDQVAEARD